MPQEFSLEPPDQRSACSGVMETRSAVFILQNPRHDRGPSMIERPRPGRAAVEIYGAFLFIHKRSDDFRYGAPVQNFQRSAKARPSHYKTDRPSLSRKRAS